MHRRIHCALHSSHVRLQTMQSWCTPYENVRFIVVRCLRREMRMYMIIAPRPSCQLTKSSQGRVLTLAEFFTHSCLYNQVHHLAHSISVNSVFGMRTSCSSSPHAVGHRQHFANEAGLDTEVRIYLYSSIRAQSFQGPSAVILQAVFW